ncbi:SRPBCC family protein [Sediminibacterium sp.]|uniref:SRPBCC family protein n=1 Tax=Sediminibacterium sp. TaxID=1917865 RepID=UPI0011DA64C2|nr:SRPBCC family protein [Sediminibacterium sp.]KAF0120695.1 MAG: Activator of Hsp90 ATPase 1 family protein [Methylocystaceae bacterium]KAF0209862.1 MAG: Activator of Hsp90 ATPase 1 family [Methylocystaceae bacterium]TXT43334.1 MAG: Activator of Hsp90 ATPase 1 family protein [Methylocystaceae bacterium]
MTALPLFHGTFTIKRSWSATPERIFSAWSDPAVKAQWFRGPPEQWREVRRSMDFRVGGVELAEGRFDNGLTTLFEARYHVIDPNCRLIYVYDLHLAGALHSVTLSSLDVQPDGDRTGVSYTEQIVFMDGKDGVEMRRGGTEWHFETIERLLQ